MLASWQYAAPTTPYPDFDCSPLLTDTPPNQLLHEDVSEKVDQGTFVSLGPGEALLIPRGHWHQGKSVADSFHITASIQSETGSTLLRRWFREALDPIYDEPAHGYAPGQVSESAKARLRSLIAQHNFPLDADAVFRDLAACGKSRE